MSDKVVAFGASDGFGEITGLELKSDSPSLSRDRARALSKKGNELAHKLKNTTTKFTSVYTIVSDTNDIANLILGKLMNSRDVTKIEISTDNGDEANTVTFEGHNHANNVHADTLQQVAIADFLPVGGVPAFGAVDFLGGTAGDNASPSSGTITFECQHNDKTDKDGDHLVGENFDAMVSAQTTWEGTPTTPADTATWDNPTSKDDPVNNTDFKTTSVSATQPMLLASPA